MAEQRRRMSQRLDRVIDQLPEPPMFGPEEPMPPAAAPRGEPNVAPPGWGYPRMDPPGGYPGYGRAPGYGPGPYGGYGDPAYGR
jgi:hypothetical protein